ncbi:MAG: DUF4344 domain-containing metallopeptidase [Nocardiaceae bacterium]|nr:DUF4344 domain-containing metallopeptidase [Nocardiaceae bacterium]
MRNAIRLLTGMWIFVAVISGCSESTTPAESSHRMAVDYEDAESAEAVRGKALLEENKVLEDFAEDVNESLVLPFDIPLIGDQCDEPNAFWSASDKVMVICYEWAAKLQELFADTGRANEAALGAVTATFYHELGHAVLHLYDLPFTGREEDVADQLAAVLLLLPEADGTPAPASDRQAVIDFADLFDRLSARNELTERHFADVHSLSRQRMYNLLCWTYGSDPSAEASLVSDGRVPDDRADECDNEFEQMSRAWTRLLQPHLKEAA